MPNLSQKKVIGEKSEDVGFSQRKLLNVRVKKSDDVWFNAEKSYR
jgi:hypothetical protein